MSENQRDIGTMAWKELIHFVPIFPFLALLCFYSIYNRIVDNIEVNKNIDIKWFNLLTTNFRYYIETSQLICTSNQLTDFYMMENAGH